MKETRKLNVKKKTRRTQYRLVIRQDLLLRGFARLANGETQMIWGRILRRYHRQGCDLIVRELVYANSLPTGNQFTPLFDWLVIRGAPVVITCVDNDQARRYVSRIAAELLRIHLDIGTIVATPASDELLDTGVNERVIAADLRMILPGACLSCVGGLQADEESELNIESSWNSGGRIGSLPSINSIAVGTSLQIYFDFLAERIQHSFWQRICWNGTQGLAVSAGAIAGDRDCPVCGTRKNSLTSTE